MSENSNTFAKIFEKLDRLTETINDVRISVVKIEERQTSNFQQNEQDHNNLTSMIVEIREDLERLKQSDEAQEAHIQKSRGKGIIYNKIFQIVLAFIGAGGLVALGSFIAKLAE